MVQQSIADLESAFQNHTLLETDNHHNREAYFKHVFNGLLGLYVGLNRESIRRFIAGDPDPHLQPGKENKALFGTLLAYIPNITDINYVDDSVFDTEPNFLQLSDVNFRVRIQEMTGTSCDGAILWDKDHFVPEYIIFDGLRKKAIAAANRLTGLEAKTLKQSIRRVMPDDFSDIHGKLPLKAGSKTLTAISIPLAIPGAVSYMLQNTVYSAGIGKVVMFDEDGTSIEAFVHHVPDLHDDLYLEREHQLVIVKREYRFDRANHHLVLRAMKYINPSDLGITPLERIAIL